ncbi:MAG: hypothetical protein P1V97_38705, partial [Planctomycetota bacterium]|nr:hypothetical protein [Planctomycetota bacterium]
PEASEPSMNVRVFWMPDHKSLLKRVVKRLTTSSEVFVEGRIVESQRALSIIARAFEIRQSSTPRQAPVAKTIFADSN